MIKEVSDFLEMTHNESVIEEIAKQTRIENLKQTQKELETEHKAFVDVLFRKGILIIYFITNGWREGVVGQNPCLTV